ncbi:hypothetical protein [Methylobacterium planeticum]|uniref:Uncharacterized protein n=1 Tax=Methylobacterium planeticum TaxID=2615211 RepID=A0A6N6MGS0_9HYPH|nr:hypothetical protein [Methylobacterium planeticum]KAB1068137.1 hypothetical protein F6X51_27175 [Methylobacterium planeticum]
MSSNWKADKEDLDWSLNKGEDVKGRDELKEAFAKSDAKFIDAAGQAYKLGQRDGHKQANFSRCAHQDLNRLYNMGR